MLEPAGPLLKHFMPSYALRQVDRVAVAASPERAYQAVRSANIEDVIGPGSGFQVIGENPGKEVVVGSSGQFRRPSIPFEAVRPQDFAAFRRPGFGKLAWSLRVDPREGGGSWITMDLRVGATDERSWARFKRYWLLIGPFSHLMRRLLLRSFARELGRPQKDAKRALPGDDLLPSARATRTDATTIEAPLEKVWPWLVQMGCRRAGWYSHDRLDNGGVRSADRIIPELQRIRPGDLLPATREDPGGFAVLRVEAPYLLVLGSPSLLPGSSTGRFGMFGANYGMTWAFVLEPVGPGATRLVVRVRGQFEPSLRMAITKVAALALHGFMEHAQLRNLKLRAEAMAS